MPSDTSCVSNIESDNNVNKETNKGTEMKNIPAVEGKGHDNAAFENA